MLRNYSSSSTPPFARISFVCLWALLFGGVALALTHLPAGYQVSRQFGKPCRIAPSDLPWKLREGGTGYTHITRHALEAWNAEGRRLGLGPFFELVSQEEDLLLDWSGAGLPRDKAAGVYWDSNLGYKRVTRLVMDGRHRVPDGNLAEILMQELGHVLGLGDSSHPSDVMHPVMRTRRAYRLSSATVTERDRKALDWLYEQPDWVPILKPNQPFLKAPPQPSPTFTPLPLDSN